MAQKTLSVKLAFSKSDVQIVYTRYGAELSVNGGQVPTQPGAPGFPVRVFEVALPEGMEAARISGRVIRSEPLTGSPTFVAPVREKGISPANAPMPGTPQTRWVPPQPLLYEAAFKDMARRTVWLTGTRTEGRIVMAGVAVRPIRYDETGCLELVTDIKITVTLRPIAVKHPRLLRAEVRPSWSARRHLFAAGNAVNPEIIEKLHVAVPTATEIDVHPPGGTTGIPMNGSVPVQVPRFVDYLIITDENAWDAATITATGNVGDLPGAFARLADWKKGRGLRTHVARLDDIVGGAYGDFTTGARDLQEVIRNFLKDFVWRHDTDWVLLGGGVDIVPARLACGGIMDGCLGFADSGGTLPENALVWNGTFLGMRVSGAFGDPAGHTLTMLESGDIVPYDPAGPAGASSPRWYHTTDDTFATFSANRTAFIRVDGDPDVINGKVQWYRYENLIPTDLYYASLYAPTYDVPGRHDWDQSGNGLYGQWSQSENLDGVDYWGDVYIGRAPVENDAEADIFVDKVIAYEQAGERPADYHRFNRMLLVAEHFGDIYKFGNILREPGDTFPPSERKYAYDAGNHRVLLNAPIARAGVDFNVVCHVSDNDYRVIPYDAGAGNGKRGWYFAKSWDNIVPSELPFPFLGEIKIPVPTQWIVICSADTAELTAELIALDEAGLDGSILEQEELREMMAKNVPSISEVRRLYSHETDLSGTAVAATPLKHLDSDALRAELSDGPHLVSMSGHGWYGGCCQFDKATVLDSLTNGDRTFIVFADSCFTNEFNRNDAISRYSLIAPNGGAVAYVGYSRFGWQANGPAFLSGFFERFIHFGRHHLGMLNASRLALASHHIDDAAYRWTGVAQNLMGDPEMPVFKDEADLRIKYVANKRTKELHERNCPWVDKMWTGNKLYLEEKEWALSHGYDGCAFCLKEHHTH